MDLEIPCLPLFKLCIVPRKDQHGVKSFTAGSESGFFIAGAAKIPSDKVAA